MGGMIYCPKCEPLNSSFGRRPLVCCACQEAETGCADDAIPKAVVDEIKTVLRLSVDDPAGAKNVWNGIL